MSLNKQLAEIELSLKHYSKIDTTVSARGVDWHLDHILKVINNVTKLTVKSNPALYKKSFNLIRTVVFTSKQIPRGKGKAPKVVNNDNTIRIEELNSQLIEAKSSIKNLKALSKTHHFNHQLFGVLNLKQTIVFLNIHTQHHLKIIKDIIK